MDSSQAILALSALSQATRLDAFRRLVRHEPDGIPAGDLARLLGVPQNTLSAHLAVLARAGLVRARRQSRAVIYRADLDGVSALALFLMQDCCGGDARACAPLLARLQPCQPSSRASDPPTTDERP